MSTEETIPMSRDARSMAQTKAAKARFTGPSALSGRATASPSDSFSRNTRHESWPLPPPGRCFPARCGAPWAATVPRAGNTAFPVHRPSDISSGANQAPQPWFSRNTKHETRITAFWFFPVPPATPRRATPTPASGFSRITSHETRITAFMMMNDDFPCAKTCRHSECPGRLGSYGRL